MSDTVKQQIQALIDRETLGLNTKNPDFFLDMIHPDMVWPWPPTSRDHDPVRWKFVLGNRAECWNAIVRNLPICLLRLGALLLLRGQLSHSPVHKCGRTFLFCRKSARLFRRTLNFRT